MIQEIAPHILDNAFITRPPKDDDIVMALENNVILGSPVTGKFYTYGEIKENPVLSKVTYVYLFSVDGGHCYLMLDAPQEFIDASKRIEVGMFYEVYPELVLGGATAMHLNAWYRSHRFCGCCGHPNKPDPVERAMTCPVCGHQAFPTISPAVIVGIVDGDRILLTRSALRKNAVYALVSGYTEVGETLEQTAVREVKEEVGLQIKNLRLYGNQPWGFSGALMVGYFAELDGDDTIRLQREELREAKWFTRDEMPENHNPLDLTHYMMEQFRLGNV